MNSMSQYVRLTKGLYDKGILVKPEEVQDRITDWNKDWYQSTYLYNEEQYKVFQQTKSIKGVRQVKSKAIWFDLDHEQDPENARLDAIKIVDRLLKHGIKENQIQAYFSGNKGYNIVITLNRFLTPEQIYSLAVNKFGKDIKTLDTSLYDAAQVLRVPGSRHQKTGLFKIPLTIKQLRSLDTNKVKQLAVSLENIDDSQFEWEEVQADDDLLQVDEVKEEKTKSDYVLNLNGKPKHWRNCKWSLLQGNFKIGERHQAMMTIASTCRALGYDELTASAMCQAADEKHVALTGDHQMKDLQETVINSVYSDFWEGGQYTCTKPGWLQTYCSSLGDHKCKLNEEKNTFIDIDNLQKEFIDYSVNFHKNIVTTGIKTLDKNVLFLCSTHNGILGQPGSGKTSLALQWLKHVSKEGNSGIFYSLDMGKPIVFAKLIQEQRGCSYQEAIELYQTDPKQTEKIFNDIKNDYKNISFNFTAGTSVEQIKLDIKKLEETTGKKTRLLIIDYLECLSGPYSDSTANTGFISQQLKDLANELNLCSVVLLQTQKHGSDINEPLLSMKRIKGSSIIEQSSTVVLTLWREGYDPKTVENDKYISFAAVKNRLGTLWTDDFKWIGNRGRIAELQEFEKVELEDFKAWKKQMKQEEAKENSEGWS